MPFPSQTCQSFSALSLKFTFPHYKFTVPAVLNLNEYGLHQIHSRYGEATLVQHCVRKSVHVVQ